MKEPKAVDLVGEDDDLTVPELSDEVLEVPETPPPEELHEHVPEEFPEIMLDEDTVVKEKKHRSLPGKSLLRNVPIMKKVVGTAKGAANLLPASEPPPNPRSGDELGQAASQHSGETERVEIVPTPNSQVAPGLAPDDRIIGETQSFEEYNTFQKSEATASDLEALVMLERAIAKGEQRRGGETNIQKYVMAAAVLMMVMVIVIYMAMELGLFDALK